MEDCASVQEVAARHTGALLCCQPLRITFSAFNVWYLHRIPCGEIGPRLQRFDRVHAKHAPDVVVRVHELADEDLQDLARSRVVRDGVHAVDNAAEEVCTPALDSVAERENFMP